MQAFDRGHSFKARLGRRVMGLALTLAMAWLGGAVAAAQDLVGGRHP